MSEQDWEERSRYQVALTECMILGFYCKLNQNQLNDHYSSIKKKTSAGTLLFIHGMVWQP
jgi:hypothetical protein